MIPTAMIVVQPDLGTALLIAASGLIVVLFACMDFRIILVALPLIALGGWGGWHVIHDYQRQRILTFLNPETDPLGAGYHIIQSQIAIGSGGVFGKGYLKGDQAQLEFLPERSTDFIFAVIGEEFGLLGQLLILTLYGVVIGRALYLAMQGQDTFARLTGGAIALSFFVYVFVNSGMVSGILPVVGVPLPLISYGGTSMVTLLAGFGILMSLHSHRKLIGS
jgi:rod shape determining protein RodA